MRAINKNIMILFLPIIVFSSLISLLEIDLEGIWLFKFTIIVIMLMYIMILTPGIFQSIDQNNIYLIFILGLLFTSGLRVATIGSNTSNNEIVLFLILLMMNILSIGTISYSLSYFLNGIIMGQKEIYGP